MRLSQLCLGAKNYSKTLNLPSTTFPLKPVKDPAHIQDLVQKVTTDLYNWQYLNHNKKDTENLFILHDGPPYANGSLHMGHALNKILKDIINRHQCLFKGKQVFYQPGWDCHGLPIESKALQETKGLGANGEPLSNTDIRSKCYDLAKGAIANQMETFQQMAIMTDWKYYSTMHKSFESNQLDLFGSLIKQGLVTRQKKPVYWSLENKTALAESELEYTERTIKSAYVRFKVSPSDTIPILSPELVNNLPLYILIWTSTPWTLPSNRAVAINRDLEYTITTHDNTNYITEKSLASTLFPDTIQSPITINGEDLLKLTYTNPLNNIEMKLIHANHVTNTMGTGLVHTAPGHGYEDYIVGLENNLEIFSPVNDDGKYTADVGIPELVGLNVLYGGEKQVIKLLKDNGSWFNELKYTHSYPYDWRSKKPVIIRATDQWFINVSPLKQHAVDALEKVVFVPERGKNRLVSFTNTRSEWCVSRQRSWGVPIPMIYVDEEPLLEVCDFVIEKLKILGTSEWFEEEDNIGRWLPNSHKHLANVAKKGKDTMDVWFDSGTSWNTIKEFLEKEKIHDRSYLADVYLEGSDQHRGWFQSSLLNKTAYDIVNKEKIQPPFKKIITHGFILDQKGKKMSKSLGNVIEPSDVIKGSKNIPGIGIDGLRLWAASADYTSDVYLSTTILKHTEETYRKYRSVLRFLLSNLPSGEVCDPLLSKVDKLTLLKLNDLNETGCFLYNNHDFTNLLKEISKYINTFLSSKYLNFSKDILYTYAEGDPKRLAVQFVLIEHYKVFMKLLAPILPLLTQEVWRCTPSYLTQGETHIYGVTWVQNNSSPTPQMLTEGEKETHSNEGNMIRKNWNNVSKVLDSVNALIESGRKDKVLKNSLECGVRLHVKTGSEFEESLKFFEEELSTIFITSHVDLVYNNSSVDDADSKNAHDSFYEDNKQKTSISEKSAATFADDKINYSVEDSHGLKVELVPAKGHKCPRCWKYTSIIEDSLCGHCEHVVSKVQ